MKPKTYLPTLAIGAAIAAALMPGGSQAQTDSDTRALAALVQEVVAQQKVITSNQAQIDERIAAISEELRTARIFAGRAGGAPKK